MVVVSELLIEKGANVNVVNMVSAVHYVPDIITFFEHLVYFYIAKLRC